MNKKWMKIKLKSLDEVIKNSGSKTHSSNIYHSAGIGYLPLTTSQKKYFGKEIKVYKYTTYDDIRTLYKCENGYAYYDEWFEWIGKPKEWIPEELWNI